MLMPDPLSTKRRFQFGLRALLVAIAFLCAILAWGIAEAKVARQRVHERAQAPERLPIRSMYTDVGSVTRPPLVWRWFGASTVGNIGLSETASADEVAEVRRLFPEATVVVLP